MCEKCTPIGIGAKMVYLIEVMGLWQTKMNGLVSDPNHYDLIALKCKSDAENICELLDSFSPIEGYKRIVTEHLYL